MYDHTVTGCTKLKIYKIGDIQTGDVQNWKCITTLLPDVQNWRCTKLEMYNHTTTGCIKTGMYKIGDV